MEGILRIALLAIRLRRGNPPCAGAFENFGKVAEQLAGHVCSVTCQIHAYVFFVLVKTVPILDTFRLRGRLRERPAGHPHGMCGDWHSLAQRVCSPANVSRQRHRNGCHNSWASLCRECFDNPLAAWYDKLSPGQTCWHEPLFCAGSQWGKLSGWAISPGVSRLAPRQ